MKKLNLFSWVLLVFISLTQARAQDCPTTINSANNLQIIYTGYAKNMAAKSVILKSRALAIGGVYYDAVFRVQSKDNIGGSTAAGSGNFIVDGNNNNNFKLDNVLPEYDPWVRYNLKFVKEGTVTAADTVGVPVEINNINIILPDLDGTRPIFGNADPRRNYADVAGFKVTGTTIPTVTMGSAIKQQGFLNGGNPGAGYTLFRPDIPANNINDNYQSVFGPNYAVNLNFTSFPPTGVDLVFGVTRDMAESSGTLADANRAFFHIFVTNCETTVPATLSVEFGELKAIIKNNTLNVNWNTVTESNNDKFIVEISKTGTDGWKKAGEIKSKATDGNTASGKEYDFSINLGSALGLMAIPALLGLFVPAFSSRRKWMLGIMAIMLSVGYFSCRKADLVTENKAGDKIYVRILQVDKNGKETPSEVKEAVKQ